MQDDLTMPAIVLVLILIFLTWAWVLLGYQAAKCLVLYGKAAEELNGGESSFAETMFLWIIWMISGVVVIGMWGGFLTSLMSI